MFEVLKPLLESELVNEETRQAIEEAWQEHVAAITEQNRHELREEFAQKYAHDKSVMVEALDKMVTEGLNEELVQIVKEKKSIAEDRVKFKKTMREQSERFDKFMVSKLAEEIKDLRSDRKKYTEAMGKFENFFVESLAEEIEDFQKDRQKVARTEAKLVAEARVKMGELRKAFIKRSAKLVEETVTKNLTSELKALKEDIKASSENDFGRQLFEAFVAEFSNSHFNTNVMVKKLEGEIKSQKGAIAEARNEAASAKKLLEGTKRELNAVKDRVKRQKVMSELLQPLNRATADNMRDLLESTETSKLREAFDRYLPTLLNSGSKNRPHRSLDKRKVVNEGKETLVEKTGNKKDMPAEAEVVELGDIRKLAGLMK